MDKNLLRLVVGIVAFVVLVGGLIFVLGRFMRSGLSQFYDVRATANGTNSYTISYKTLKPAITRVEYGTSTYYPNSLQLSENYSIDHEAVLHGLLPGKPHVYRIVGVDEKGKTYTSNFFGLR